VKLKFYTPDRLGFDVASRRKAIIPTNKTTVPNPNVMRNPNFCATIPMQRAARTSPLDPTRLWKESNVALCGEGMCLLYKFKKMGSLKLTKVWRRIKNITAKRGEVVKAISNRLIRNKNSRIIREEISCMNPSERVVTLPTKRIVKIEAIARIQPKY
jgi:hypothetical protein